MLLECCFFTVCFHRGNIAEVGQHNAGAAAVSNDHGDQRTCRATPREHHEIQQSMWQAQAQAQQNQCDQHLHQCFEIPTNLDWWSRHCQMQQRQDQTEEVAQQNGQPQEQQRNHRQLESRDDDQERHPEQLQQQHQHQPEQLKQQLGQSPVQEQDRQQLGRQIQLGVLSRSMSGQFEMPSRTSSGERGFVWCDLTNDDASDPLGNWWQTGDLWKRDWHDSAGQAGGVGGSATAAAAAAAAG